MTAIAPAPAAVVAIDLDGTLLRDTSVSVLLAEHLGHRDVLTELEEAFAAGAISNAIIADRSAALLRGVPIRDVARVLAGARWLLGIAEGVETLHRHRMRVVVASITWRFAAAIVARRFGMDGTCGTEMNVVRGRLAGAVSAHFDAHDKAEFARRYCLHCGIDCSRLIAVGDARSDLPLFALARFAIAVNGTESARQAATVTVETDDFREVADLIVTQTQAWEAPL